MSVVNIFNSIKTSLLSAATTFTRPVALNRNVGTYVGWHMKKDQKRRMCVKEHSLERTRLVAVKRCTLLPPEIREIASEDVIALPRDSNYIRLRDRCYVTSRPRAVLRQFRVSRLVFRDLADYNKLSGVQRAMW